MNKNTLGGLIILVAGIVLTCLNRWNAHRITSAWRAPERGALYWFNRVGLYIVGVTWIVAGILAIFRVLKIGD